MRTMIVSVALLAVVVGAVSLIPTPKTQAVNPGYQTFQVVN
jgi:hypothetical protein